MTTTASNRLRRALLIGGFAASGALHAQNAPVYSAAQAERGLAAYNGAGGCVACHGADLSGGQFGPSLKGVSFRNRWAGMTMAELFEQLRQMPPGGGGSLGDAVYADLAALILSQNNFAAGSAFPTDPTALRAMAMPGERRAETGFVRLKPGTKLPFYPAPANPLEKITPVTDALLSAAPEGEWLQWRRTWDAHAYSPLKQVTKSNAKNLQLAWSFALPAGPNTTTPLVHDGVMFLFAQDNVVALDARSGELLWRYVHPLPQGDRSSAKRALALYGNKVYAPTSDGRVVALDVQTGKVVWNEPVDNDVKASTTGGLLAAKGKLMLGTTGFAPGGGYIQAFDAETGKKLWRFYGIPRPGEKGSETWNGTELAKMSGGSVWTPGYYDPENDLVFFSPTPTYDTKPLRDPSGVPGTNNDALFTDTTIALNPDTGKLVWYYQHMQNDQWDLDWGFERQIVNLKVNGVNRRAVVTGGKLGIFDAMDAKTGEYLSSTDMGWQTLVTSIDPKTGYKNYDRNMVPGDGVAKFLCPHAGGGRSWMPTAMNGAAKVIYIPAVETCMNMAPVAAGERGALSTGVNWELQPHPKSDGNYGRLQAINLETQKTLWTQRERAPTTTGVLATAGGVLFAGSLDRFFKAYDQSTGKILWKSRLGDVPSAAPITYSVDGKQYVAMVVGYGAPQSASFGALVPEIVTPVIPSSSVSVFALP
jgi:alcohol dehydrogenase (cytochrome c)